MMELMRRRKEEEQKNINNNFNEYKQMSAVQEENVHRMNKKLQEFNKSQEAQRREYLMRDTQLRKNYMDSFVDDLNAKKESQYYQKQITRNHNVFQHMKDYQNYLGNNGPSFLKTIKSSTPYPYDAVNLALIEESSRGNLEALSGRKSPLKQPGNQSPQRTLKRTDDTYNKYVSEDQSKGLKYNKSQIFTNNTNQSQDLRLIPANSTNKSQNLNSNRYNNDLQQSDSLSLSSKNGYSGNSAYSFKSSIQYLGNKLDNKLLSMMIIKMRNLGVEGMIHLYHQFMLKDKSGVKLLDFYDFRGVIIGSYKIDFNFEDCKDFIHSRARSLNLNKISYKDFLFSLGNYNERRMETIKTLIGQLDKDSDGFVHYFNELINPLNSNIESKPQIKEFIRLIDHFFLNTYSNPYLNTTDIHCFFSCISVKYESDNDFEAYIQSLF